MNRLGKLMTVKAFSKERLASALDIEESAIINWESGACEIDEKNLGVICQYFGVSKEYLSGLAYRLTLPISKWTADLQEDYYQAGAELREFMECKYGKPIYYMKKEEPTGKSRLHDTIVCREGNGEFFKVTEEQMDFLEAFLDTCEKKNQD